MPLATPRAEAEKRSAMTALAMGLQTLSPAAISIRSSTSCQYAVASPISRHAARDT